MKTIAVAIIGCIAVSTASFAESQILIGVENASFSGTTENVKNNDSEASTRHSWTAAVIDWRINENFVVSAGLGGLTSTLEDKSLATTTYSADDGFYFSIGGGMDQALDTGGAIILDLNFSSGTIDMGANREYNHSRWAFLVAVGFGDPTRAQPYFGANYNLGYSSVLKAGSTELAEYQFAEDLSFVAGLRAKADTFMGVMQATIGAELGVKLALEFGF